MVRCIFVERLMSHGYEVGLVAQTIPVSTSEGLGRVRTALSDR